MNDLVWLQRSAVQVFLNRLVDRLDRADASGASIQRAVKVDPKSFPALFGAELESEREELWSCVEKLAELGWIAIKLDRAKPGQAAYERAPRVNVLNAEKLRLAVARPQRVKSVTEVWREAVQATLEAPQEVRDAASRYLIEIPGRTAQEIVESLNQIRAMLNEPLLLREVSSKVFWGHSKVLDGRQSLVAALLGTDECPFPEMPIQLHVYLPSDDFDGVLFIENLATFERATREEGDRFKRLAIVYAAGFKASAKRLRVPQCVSLYFAERGSLASAAREKLRDWLFNGLPVSTWFWGDLDYAGMEILKALRGLFAGLQSWEPGYGPLVEALRAGHGHSASEAGKAAQKPIDITGCPYADAELLPLIREVGRFVDQEAA